MEELEKYLEVLLERLKNSTNTLQSITRSGEYYRLKKYIEEKKNE